MIPVHFDTDKQMQEIKDAVKSLGYHEAECIRLDGIDETRCRVIVNNTYLGTYDFNRHTFVD